MKRERRPWTIHLDPVELAVITACTLLTLAYGILAAVLWLKGIP